MGARTPYLHVIAEDAPCEYIKIQNRSRLTVRVGSTLSLPFMAPIVSFDDSQGIGLRPQPLGELSTARWAANVATNVQTPGPNPNGVASQSCMTDPKGKASAFSQAKHEHDN